MRNQTYLIITLIKIMGRGLTRLSSTQTSTNTYKYSKCLTKTTLEKSTLMMFMGSSTSSKITIIMQYSQLVKQISLAIKKVSKDNKALKKMVTVPKIALHPSSILGRTIRWWVILMTIWMRVGKSITLVVSRLRLQIINFHLTINKEITRNNLQNKKHKEV